MSTKIMELVGVGENAGAILSKGIFEERDRILAGLKKLTPDCMDFLAIAQVDVKEAKTLLSSVESARKQVKAPVIELGKSIDAAAAKFSAELTPEVDRIERQIGDIVRKAREEKLAEERRLQAEQAEILRKQAAQEAALQRKLDEASSAKQQAKLQEAIKESREAALAKAGETTAQLSEVRHTPILSGGSQVRGKWVADVVDAKVAYAARPDLFDIVFSKERFNAAMKLDEAKTKATPGLNVYQEIKASIR